MERYGDVFASGTGSHSALDGAVAQAASATQVKATVPTLRIKLKPHSSLVQLATIAYPIAVSPERPELAGKCPCRQQPGHTTPGVNLGAVRHSAAFTFLAGSSGDRPT